MKAHRLSALLGLTFFVLYLGWGLLFCTRAPRAFRYVDEMFDADIPSRVTDLTHPQGVYERTAPHPFLVLLLNPFGFGLREILRSSGIGNVESDRLAAVALCALAGGMAVGLFHRLLTRLGLAPPFAALWTLVFGLSASAMFFGCLPESYGFSALTLIAMFLIATRPALPLAGLLAASAACAGMVVTNIVAVALVRARWLDRRRPVTAIRSFVGFFALFLLVAVALGALQHWIYPGTGRLIMTELSGTDRAAFVLPDDWPGVSARAADLAAHFVFFDLAAPRINVVRGSAPPVRVEFLPPAVGMLRGVGRAHALVWMAILAVALVAVVRTRILREPLAILLALWLCFSAGLQAVFGPCIFLRASQWTFAVVALVAIAVDRLLAERLRWRPLLLVTLGLLVALQAVNNLQFMTDLFQVFARAG